MSTASKSGKVGRRAGGHNKGYFYRSDRGYWVSSNKLPLTDETGAKLTDRKTPDYLLRASLAALEARQAAEAVAKAKAAGNPAKIVLLADVCREYTDWVAAEIQRGKAKPKTLSMRRRFLQDFCKTYGGVAVSRLTQLEVTKWVASHKGWKSNKPPLQALKRALNWAVQVGMIEANPIKGMKVDKSGERETYFTPEQEAAIVKGSKRDFAFAFRVLIRTGARYGVEFCKLRAEHVHNYPTHQEWVWPQGSKVTGKARVVMITDPEIIKAVNDACKKHPQGLLFRKLDGSPWTVEGLKGRFGTAKRRAIKAGIRFDRFACLYTCRHTFAKRVLAGYWTGGKHASLHDLAYLMGNTYEICEKHYAKWCEAYKAPLLEVLG